MSNQSSRFKKTKNSKQKEQLFYISFPLIFFSKGIFLGMISSQKYSCVIKIKKVKAHIFLGMVSSQKYSRVIKIKKVKAHV